MISHMVAVDLSRRRIRLTDRWGGADNRTRFMWLHHFWLSSCMCPGDPPFAYCWETHQIITAQGWSILSA